MTIDTRYAYFADAKGKEFQVLQPKEYAEVQVVDSEGNPTGETELVELPREWDEAATAKAMKGG